MINRTAAIITIAICLIAGGQVCAQDSASAELTVNITVLPYGTVTLGDPIALAGTGGPMPGTFQGSTTVSTSANLDYVLNASWVEVSGGDFWTNSDARIEFSAPYMTGAPLAQATVPAGHASGTLTVVRYLQVGANSFTGVGDTTVPAIDSASTTVSAPTVPGQPTATILVTMSAGE